MISNITASDLVAVRQRQLFIYAHGSNRKQNIADGAPGKLRRKQKEYYHTETRIKLGCAKYARAETLDSLNGRDIGLI